MWAGRAEPRSSLPLPVVPHDGGGQHTREKPTKLRQRVEQGSVVRLHVGALRGNVRISRGWVGGAGGLAAPRSRPTRLVPLYALCRMRLCVCVYVYTCQKPSLTSMTVHCSTTMVSLAGGEGLLSSYTNSPSNDRGTGSPGKTAQATRSQVFLQPEERWGGWFSVRRGGGAWPEQEAKILF